MALFEILATVGSGCFDDAQGKPMTQQDNGAVIATADQGRRFDIDALRIFAFSLLILYHVGMFYVQGWGWHVKSAYQFAGLHTPRANSPRSE